MRCAPQGTSTARILQCYYNEHNGPPLVKLRLQTRHGRASPPSVRPPWSDPAAGVCRRRPATRSTACGITTRPRLPERPEEALERGHGVDDDDDDGARGSSRAYAARR